MPYTRSKYSRDHKQAVYAQRIDTNLHEPVIRTIHIIYVRYYRVINKWYPSYNRVNCISLKPHDLAHLTSSNGHMPPEKPKIPKIYGKIL